MDRFDEQRANYEETQRIVNDYFDKNNLDDWGNPKPPKVVKKSPQQEIAERNLEYQQKWGNASPLATGLSNMSGSDWADVGGQALQGAERIADGATFGGYGWLDRTRGGNYDERKQKLQEQADSAGIGGLNSVTGAGLELAGNIAGGGSALVSGFGKLGMQGGRLAVATGSADGMLNSAFATQNAQDLPMNMLTGGVFGGVSSFGFDKGLKLAGRGLMPVAEKFSPTLHSVNQMRRGYTGDMGVDEAMQSASNMQQRGSVPSNYAATPEDALQNAMVKNQQAYRQLDKVGDLEKEEITRKLSRWEPKSGFNPDRGLMRKQYADIIEDQADKLGIKITENKTNLVNGGVNHFILNKNSEISNRAPFVRTLKETVNNNDIQFSQGVNDYYVRKYTDLDKKTPFYDFVVKKNGNLHTKFPTDEKYLAGQLKEPFDNLSVKGDRLGNMGISPSPSDTGSLSEIGSLVNRNQTVNNTIKGVKASHPEWGELPDTNFNIMDEAGRQLSQQGRNIGGRVGWEAENAAQQMYSAMDKVVPAYGTYRQSLSRNYNQELSKMLSQKDLSSLQRYIDFGRGKIDASIPGAIGGEASKYWVK